MKKYLLLLAMMCFVAFWSCSKDDGIADDDDKNKTEQSQDGNKDEDNNDDSDESPNDEEFADFIETASGLNMKMIYVEGGEFMMGATEEQEDEAYSDEYPVRKITLDSFYIAECEITQSQWEKIMGTNPSYFEGDNNPVECVSWNEAQEFCEKLSTLTGKKYALPTEAQWEYAARGGKNHDGTIYSGSNNIDDVAWYWYNSDSKTHPVKTKRPNSLGLYDMNGNVWEWCQDWYASHYDEADTTNPTGPTTGSNRVLRGGSWFTDARSCRVSYRGFITPGYRHYGFGFRVVVLP